MNETEKMPSPKIAHQSIADWENCLLNLKVIFSNNSSFYLFFLRFFQVL